MTRSPVGTVRRLFGKTIALTPAQRESYLTRACPDENLRGEVLSLLAECDSDENLLNLYSSIGGKVLSHYQILGRIGVGGMGIVYQARDRRLGRPVAIKVLDPLDMDDAESQKRLLNEARYASALNHPNIVTIHETGRARGLRYVVMEYVAGTTLDRLIPRSGWPVPESLGYLAQIANALAAAHARGIVHGDLKPGNIMVSETGQLKLMDFGLAQAFNSPSRRQKGKRTAPRLGTKAYMAPELLLDRSRDPDPRSDVFSYGLIAYEMMTGCHPFGSGNPTEIAEAICRASPSAFPEKVSAPLVKIVERCLEKSPNERFSSMNDVSGALAQSAVITSVPSPEIDSSGSSASEQSHRIQRIVSRIGYSNIARSRAALSELESLLTHGASAAMCEAAAAELKEVILTMPDSQGNGVSDAVRDLRKSVASLLKMASGHRLNECFREKDLEHLDFYGMDFTSADLAGLSFRRSFLVEANFNNSRLVGATFAGAYLRNASFEGADLANTNFTDADWFNAIGLKEKQLSLARRDTLMECPGTSREMHRYLSGRYGFPFESWSRQVQDQLKKTWGEYLQSRGLRTIVSGWRRNSGRDA